MEFVGGPLGSCIGELEGAFIKLKKEVVFMQAKVEASEKEKNSVLAKNLELERNYNILNNDNLEYIELCGTIFGFDEVRRWLLFCEIYKSLLILLKWNEMRF